MAIVALVIAAALAQAPADASASKPTAAASVAPASSSAAKPTAVAAKNDDPVVCRSIAVTGTRFPERTCMTKSAWETQGQDARDVMNGFQKAGSAGH